MMIDAGSSGTRLYAYEESGGAYSILGSASTKVGVSYPAEGRDCAGGSGAACGVEEVVQAVRDLTHTVDTECTDYASVSLYATAGMRLAEQSDVVAAEQTWAELRGMLHEEFPNARVRAHTLSGFEEGLYSWLTVNSLAPGHGVLEMGGASLQVAYGCEDCQGARRIKLPGAVAEKLQRQEQDVYAYSFLGLGAHKARSLCDFKEHCRAAPGITADGCRGGLMTLTSDGGILDPFNFTPQNGTRGNYVQLHTSSDLKWWGMGVFGTMDASTLAKQADEMCGKTTEELEAEEVRYAGGACFERVYLESLLDAFHVASPRLVSGHNEIDGVSLDWTSGALMCDAIDCLGDEPPTCRWMPDHQCLRGAA